MKDLIGYDVTHEHDLSEGQKIGDVHAELDGHCVIISAMQNGEEWAPFQSRQMKIDCTDQDQAALLYKKLVSGGENTIEAMRGIYRTMETGLAKWFRPLA